MIGSLYVHVPLCLRKCDYCDFYSLPSSHPLRAEIVPLLLSELRLRHESRERREASEAKASLAWDTVYVGGGTPSVLSPEEIYELARGIGPLAPDGEWTVEANPEDLSPDWIDALASGGVNRLSLGIQSLTDRLLKAVGRRGSRETALRGLALARARWKGRLSLDLIAGLPGQTEEDLARDIAEALSFGPDHVSLYALTVEEGTPLAGRFRPDEESSARLWLAGRDALEEAGLRQYEVSNFARPGSKSRHNLVYWRMGSWLAVGPSASGTEVSQDHARRYRNACDLERWAIDPVGSAETEDVSRLELVEETMMMGFRLREGISRNRFRARFGTDILNLIGPAASRWADRGLLVADEGAVALTADGLALLNLFLADCMECLWENEHR